VATQTSFFAGRLVGAAGRFRLERWLLGANVVQRDLIDLGAGIDRDFIDMTWDAEAT